MDYKDKIKEILKDKTIPEGQRSKLKEILRAAEMSEDERIRKALISLFSNNAKKDWYGIPTEKILAWLEKQDTTAQLSEENQNRFAKCVLSSCALSFINYLDAHKYEGKMCVSNGECEDIENAFQNAIWDKLHRYYCKYIENKNEQPRYNIGDVLCDKSCTTLDKNAQPNFKIVDIRNDMYICDKCSFPICQQDEYELVSKYEPKFKIGEWILNNVCLPIKISSIEDDMYRFDDGSALSISFIDGNYHLWSIADAKDGDVLCCESGWTCIFKALNSNNISFSSYCFMDKDGWFCETGSDGHTLEKSFIKAYNGNIYPATKEQKEILFMAMTEAGYTFDFEEKKLKDVESSTTWSEEDESYLDHVFTAIKAYYSNDKGHENPWREELLCWLKSLKGRVGCEANCTTMWKPSEEQVKAFEHFVRSIGESGYASPYENNTKLLYSLLGQLKKLTE